MTLQDSQKEPVWSVSDVNRAMREMVENGFRSFWITGEVGSLLLHRSGHAYFTLKDDKSQLKACWFSGVNAMRDLNVANGTRIEARGNLGVYETRGEYQFNCREMRIAGVGDLHRKFEELAKRLAAEGLFASERKKPIPRMPGCIGVVTSSNGAAVRDFLNIVNRRFSGLHIRIYPCRVQGAGAAETIASGVEFFNRAGNVDVIVVTRGGGSMEDLWCFNEECVARAVAASRIPVISAVGHEIDTTICDFAADLRVPTPSAAAELVTSDRMETERRLQYLENALTRSMNYSVSSRKAYLGELIRRFREPERRIANLKQHLDELDIHISRSVTSFLHRSLLKLEKTSAKLEALDPAKMLNNGYVFVSDAATGKPVKSSKQRPGTGLLLTFADGQLKVRTESRKSENNIIQGELF